MAPAGGGGGSGVKGFYRQTKKIRGGVAKAKPSASTKRSKNKQQQCIQDDSCHGEDEKAEEELRRFDVDMRYGPCIGVTRLRRWERAAAMGLRPPPHLRDHLLLLRAPADYSSSSTSTSSNKSQPKNSANTTTDSSRSSNSASLQLECIWAGKI